jgi:methylenetetrahydrofolate dehydrogenase (NADP+)/methenyltetrahydrofolate cyclohydrolase
MKLLSGLDLAGFIKERQARQVRALIQAHSTKPRLVIIQTKDDPVINTYVRLKKQYGRDILVDVEALLIKQDEALKIIESRNDDPRTHGIIIQLPLSDPSQTDTLIHALSPQKDIDGLGPRSPFGAATAMAIEWLLAGYNVSLQAKKIVIVGSGRLVGQPLYQLWQQAGYTVTVLDSQTEDLANELKFAEIIVTATGVPGLLKSDMIPIGAVVVDAGVASESGKTVGDVAPDVYERHDLTMTPKIGGVGPLTVAALFDNVIRAASSHKSS